MGNELFLVDIPWFEPEYKNDEIYDYDGKGKNNLNKLLNKTSKGYCMYCYAKVDVDGKSFGQLEHTIEKNNCKRLKNCVPNISIACPICNQSFKKRGEQKRKLTKEDKRKFVSGSCLKEKCKKRCTKYNELMNCYLKKDGANIILQPFGVKNYYLQYDVLDQKFRPHNGKSYTEDDISFITNHINRFNLNEPTYRTKEIKHFVEDILEYDGKIPLGTRYNNLIVELFREKICNLDLEKRVKICEILVTYWISTMKG